MTAPLYRAIAAALLTVSGACSAAPAAPAEPGQAAADALARDIYQQLVEINTTDSSGNVTTAAEAVAQRFRDAGFPAADVVVLGPNDRKKNLVVRLHGSGRHRPVLLIGHLDVVEARREDWSTDPFKLVEKDGYFYGRGTLDMKSGDAIMASALLRMQQRRLPSAPRHHPRAHRGRGGRLLQRRGVAAAEPSRADRRGVRAESRRPGRLLDHLRARRAAGVRAERHREDVCRLPADRHQPWRPQLPAAARQCHLRAGAGR